MVRKEQLIEYLTAVQNLEQHKYTIEQTINRLHSKINSLGHPEEVELSLSVPEPHTVLEKNIPATDQRHQVLQ